MTSTAPLEALAHLLARDPNLVRRVGPEGIAVRAPMPHPVLRGMVVEQTFRPAADRLKAAGFTVTRRLAGTPGAAVVLVTPHKEETLANLARAWTQLRPGGVLILAGENGVGGKSIAKQVATALGGARREAMRKCTLLIAEKQATPTPADFAAWAEADRPQVRVENRFFTRPGLFSWKAADKGSRLLRDHLPGRMAGRVADLGAGWGYLAAAIAERADSGSRLDLYEAEWKAIGVARLNLAAAPDGLTVRYRWVDVAAATLPRGAYDWVVTNPPFHEGQSADPAIGRAFLERASAMLRPGGTLLAVANRHLPYEQVLERHYRRWSMLADAGGYKVFRALR